MIDQRHITTLVKALGYENLAEFQNKTRLTFRGTVSYVNNNLLILDFCDDMFYKTYNSPTVLNLSDLNGFPSNEVLNVIKTRISAKLRRTRVLEEIKKNGLKNIREFLKNHFDIDPELVNDEDIVFSNVGQFTVAGVLFTYRGTVKEKSCNITEATYSAYRDSYVSMIRIIRFKQKKQAEHDSKH